MQLGINHNPIFIFLLIWAIDLRQCSKHLRYAYLGIGLTYIKKKLTQYEPPA